MMLNFLISSFSITILFIYLNHPLSLGLILLIQTILIALITGLLNYNYWFSYILFLIMIGGMLVLFIYMTSIASNEKFKFSSKLMSLMIMMTILMCLSFFIDHFMTLPNLILDLNNQNLTIQFKWSLNKIFNWPMNLIFYLMIIYLLITLIMVVKITNIQYGPLRQKF